MEEDQGAEEEQEEKEEANLVTKAEVAGKATSKSWKSQKKLIPFKVFIIHLVLTQLKTKGNRVDDLTAPYI